MKLTIGRHLYTWDPVTWLHGRFLYGKFKRISLTKTLQWNDILGNFIGDVPEEIPPYLYNSLQELRRDIMHYHVKLKDNKL